MAMREHRPSRQKFNHFAFPFKYSGRALGGNVNSYDWLKGERKEGNGTAKGNKTG